ncbi:hypothetical protein [Amphritea opalescens]|nr:hypothetical protein [Amphritea opalescens]
MKLEQVLVIGLNSGGKDISQRKTEAANLIAINALIRGLFFGKWLAG